jgi:hypothetical protein
MSVRNCARAAVVLLSIAMPLSALADEPIAAPALAPGETWVFDRVHEQGANGFSQQRLDLAVERVSDDSMVIGVKPDGAPRAFEDHMMGADWSQSRIFDSRQTVIGRPFVFPLKIGDSWTVDYDDPTHQGVRTFAHGAGRDVPCPEDRDERHG